MANVYKNIQAIITSSGSDDDMYTSPDATTSIVKTIRLYNIHSGALSVTTKIYDLSATTDYQYDTSSVLASDSVDILTFNNIVILEAGDKIRMQTPTGNKI